MGLGRLLAFRLKAVGDAMNGGVGLQQYAVETILRKGRGGKRTDGRTLIPACRFTRAREIRNLPLA